MVWFVGFERWFANFWLFGFDVFVLVSLSVSACQLLGRAVGQRLLAVAGCLLVVGRLLLAFFLFVGGPVSSFAFVLFGCMLILSWILSWILFWLLEFLTGGFAAGCVVLCCAALCCVVLRCAVLCCACLLARLLA